MERTEAEIAAQEELLKIADELERIQTRLWEVHASLPAPPERTREEEEDGDEEMEVAMEVRAIIECVVNDWIGAAIRDFWAGAEYRLDRAGDRAR
jgi:hypothetical protein